VDLWKFISCLEQSYTPQSQPYSHAASRAGCTPRAPCSWHPAFHNRGFGHWCNRL